MPDLSTEDWAERISEVLLLLANDLATRNLKFGEGAIPCPFCKTGTIWYSIPKPRHGQAACSTPGCIQFIS